MRAGSCVAGRERGEARAEAEDGSSEEIDDNEDDDSRVDGGGSGSAMPSGLFLTCRDINRMGV